MVEAIPSLQHVALQARLAHAAITLARQQAEKTTEGPRAQASVHRKTRDRHHGEGLPRSASRADRRGKADR